METILVFTITQAYVQTMPVVKQTRTVPFRPEQMFDLVVDVANYPEFLPWCVASRVREQSETHIVADLVIGFKLVRERFTSRVTLDREALAIDTALVEGPFKHMTNNWRFNPANDGKSTEIDIHVDFAFRSAILQRLLEPFFEEAQRRLIGAFEKRAFQLYGDPSAPAALSNRPKASATV